MIDRKVERRECLSVNIYRKRDNKAGLVFLKRGKRFRITTVSGCDKLLTALSDCGDLSRPKVIRICSPRQRNWIIELGQREDGLAALTVWEFERDGSMKNCFNWNGELRELKAALPVSRPKATNRASRSL